MWTNRQLATLGVVCATSLGAGGVSGWFLAKRSLNKKFEVELDREVKATKAFYQHLNKPDPEDLAKSYQENLDASIAALSKHQYDTTSDEIPKEILDRIVEKVAEAEREIEEEAQPVSEGHNAFENPAPAWVQVDEELERRNGVPYIISHDEFYENPWEFEQGHLTYYEGDDTLADSRDEPIADQYAAVGELTLEKFGHGSKDPNIVYACNEGMEMVFEIARSTKSFSEDVLGFLQHGDTKHRRPEWDG